MSTTLLVAEQELSRQIGDYWASTTTGDGLAGGTTLVDSALIAKQNDWITKESYDFITEEPVSTAAIYEERLITGLSNTLGTLTVLAHGTGGTGQIASGIDYEIHRLFSPSEKRRALIASARMAYPHIFKEIRDESLVSGNWLKDGSFEIWTSDAALTYWTKSAATTTLAKTSTVGLFKHGSYSCTMTQTAAGNISQSITNWDDLKKLAGKSVTFTVQGKCDTASCLRIGIYDGTTTTKSSFLDQTTGWTQNNEPLTVTATIQDHPSSVTFYIYNDVVAGTSYIDDARVIYGDNGKVYIGNLGLARNKPHQVLIEQSDYSTAEPWIPIRGITYDTTNGYMYLPDWVSTDYRLRILGIGYLDFLTSAGVSSDTWTNTVAIDKPQLDILVAQAALYLYTEMSMPNFSQGTREKYMEMIGYWRQELADRIAKFGMIAPSAMVQWS